MIKKSTVTEIEDTMAELLKEAMFPISFEYFHKTLNLVTKCEDLQLPWRWIESGKCASYQDQAFQMFLAKEKELKEKFGNNCKTRL